MLSLPSEFYIVLEAFRPLFSAPVWSLVQTLLLGAILCQRQRTVASCLRAVGLEREKNFGKYHRVLNRASWSSKASAKILLGLLIKAFVPANAPLLIGVDETLERRSGKKIKAKGPYRDAVRSKGKHVVICLGLEWLCFMILVPVPWNNRYWALPFWSLLLPSKKSNHKAGKRHKTSIDWTIQALKQLRRWHPFGMLILLADGGFASFDLLENSCRLHIILITRLRIDAKLYDFPEVPPPGKRGPKPKKGSLLPSLKTLSTDQTQEWRSTSLHWYQIGEKKISYLSGIALWHKTKHDPLPIKWVLVWIEGKKTPQAFFSNQIELDALEILTQYMKRWGVEVTFEEARSHLGVETQRQWSDLAIARTTPILFGLFSLICLTALKIYHQETIDPAQRAWYQKQEITFSDLMAAMRRKIWARKYLNSKKSNEPMLFSQDEVKTLINQLLNTA